MDRALAQAYATRIEQDLRENILPYWMTHALDLNRGGFVGEINGAGQVVTGVERGSLLTSRILWTFSAAARLYNDPAYRAVADWAKQDLLKTFWDGEFGGVYWSVDASGRPLKTRKQVYGLAFAIYALSEHHRATGDRDSLDRAISMYRQIETHSWDPVHGGYWEAHSREWQTLDDVRLSDIDMNEPKSQNTHLHIMEGYTNLLRAWPDAGLRAAQKRLVGVMLDKILDAKTHHLGLFFNREWAWRTDRISYGHDIEAAWLLTEAAEVVGDAGLLARVRAEAVAIADVTLPAIDADGGLLYEGLPGSGPTVFQKEWWPQVEGAVGFLNAYQISGDKRHLHAAIGLWNFIEAHLIDRDGGEWHRAVSRDQKVLTQEAKLSFWKCPYHNGRGCMELAARLRSL